MSSFSTAPSASVEVMDRFVANVDVWQAIFEMLPVKERIRLEMTNKRLRILMFACWKQVTSIDTKCELSYNPLISKNRSAPLVAICIDRIGDGLRSLTIREKFFPTTFWSASIPSIGEGCPNVETINFIYEGRKFEKRTLDIPFDSFSRLKTLTVSTAEGHFIRASPSIFLSIPVSIEVIRGLKGKWEEPFENAAQMEGFFAHRPSLREVYLDGLDSRDGSKADIFRVIADRCPHLKSINLSFSYCFDYTGVVALESMKELRLPSAVLDEMQIVTICKRSPLVEALELYCRFSLNLDLQSAALSALGALTKLCEFCLYVFSVDVVAPSVVTEFVRGLARNSGASLRRLQIFDWDMPLPTAAIEALANGCGKLRRVDFGVCVYEATPASIRFLIDSIVNNPDWAPLTGEPALQVRISLLSGYGYAIGADRAAFEALAAPAANLPAGIQLDI